MEQHPIPQNVTTFQFRLIGDMTIKQFGYLAGGIILAYICYKLPLPFFFTWPLAIAAGLLGFGLAFVPIEERPMDIWILAFLKNVYSPTQYVWQKTTPPPAPAAAALPIQNNAGKQSPSPAPRAASGTGLISMVNQLVERILPVPAPNSPAAPATPPAPETRVATPMPPTQIHQSTIHKQSTAELIAQLFGPHESKQEDNVAAPIPPTILTSSSVKEGMFDWLKNFFGPKSPAPPPRVAFTDAFANTPLPVVTGKRLDLSGAAPPTKPETPSGNPQQPVPAPATQEHISRLESNLDRLKKELEGSTLSQKRILELQKQLTEVLSQKDKLETEVAMLRKSARETPKDAPTYRPAGVSSSPAPLPTVRVMTPDVAKKAGLPRLTTFPNIVTGIIKDGNGNLLTGVLVTVRDKNDIPLRALKTNKLGQFAASTQLPSGIYLIEVEDPRGNYTFDRIQITVSGVVMPPIEIFAKSQKQISRDKLAREIFGSQKI